MDCKFSKSVIAFLFVLFPIFNPLAGENTKKAMIIFTGEDNGRLEPCGCTSGQLGGFTRRHFWINHFIQNIQRGHLIILSNGDLVSAQARQDEIKYETMVQAMNEMGYQVMNLGEKDFQMGEEFLKSIQQRSHFVFVSSNVFKTDQTRIFEPFYTRKISEDGRVYQINFAGILSPDFQMDLGSSLIISDPKEALGELIKNQSGQDIYWILMYHGKEKEALELVRAFPEILMVITGHDVEEPEQGTFEPGEIPWGAAPMNGKYVGCAEFDLSSTEIIGNIEYFSLNETVGSSETIKELLKNYDQVLRSEELFKDLSGRLVGDSLWYSGSEICGLCHWDQYKIWKDSLHARAYQALAEKEKQYDPDCLVCHTIGYKYASGFISVESTPQLTHVGCESCHGSGFFHIYDPLKYPLSKSDRNVCLGCHDSENSPKFEYEKYWEKIKHGKD